MAGDPARRLPRMPSPRRARDSPSGAPAQGWQDRAPAPAQDNTFERRSGDASAMRSVEAFGCNAHFGGERCDARHDVAAAPARDSRSNEMARFWATVIAFEKHDAIADDTEALDKREPFVAVGYGARRAAQDCDLALVGQRRPVIRLTKTSAAGRSKPRSMVAPPAGTRRSRTRSGRNPPYCFSTPVQDKRVGHY